MKNKVILQIHSSHFQFVGDKSLVGENLRKIWICVQQNAFIWNRESFANDKNKTKQQQNAKTGNTR